jgi:hypothetical protein
MMFVDFFTQGENIQSPVGEIGPQKVTQEGVTFNFGTLKLGGLAEMRYEIN